MRSVIASALIVAGYFVVWALVHSLLASLPFKRWVRERAGAGFDRWYRLVYVVFATVTLVPILAMLALLPDRVLYVVPVPWRWLMVGGQALALFGIVGAVLQTGPTYFLGLSQLFGDWEGQEQDDILLVRGFYCRVRHPLYLFSIILIWLTPAMTVNLMVWYGLMTLYFYAGSIHEEQRLVAEFGQAYRRYRQVVPRLIPTLGICYDPDATPE